MYGLDLQNEAFSASLWSRGVFFKVVVRPTAKSGVTILAATQ